MDVAASSPVESTALRVSPRRGRVLRRIGFWVALLILISPVLFVFLWMLSLSLKPNVENIAYPPIWADLAMYQALGMSISPAVGLFVIAAAAVLMAAQSAIALK